MSTVTLPPPPQPVTPLDVDPASIRSCGGQLLAASAQIDDLGTFVAGEAQIDDWLGEGSTAYHVAIRPIGRQADAMSLALRGVARRVEDHADRMQALKDTGSELVEHRQTLVGAIESLRDRVTGADEADAPGLQAEADQLAAQIRGFELDRQTWTSDIAAEEQAMSEAFARVLDLDAVDRLYAGQSDPADAALAGKPPAGSDPRDVNAWWDSLTREQQEAIIAASPGSIGNLDGIPVWARSEANTVSLDRDLADWHNLEEQGLLTDDETTWLKNAEAADEARTNIGTAKDPITGEPISAQIYIYDPTAFDGDGRIAISAGDLGTADNVAITVPGFGTDAQSAPYLGERALDMYEAARIADPSATNSTLFWIGYDAPDNIPILGDGDGDASGVLQEGMATAGGDRLADTIDGLRASHEGDPAHLTVLGHSYGSTTVGHALGDHSLDVDDVIVVGSPGLGDGVDHPDDLGVADDHFWAGANSHDPIAYLADDGWVGGSTLGGAGLGSDPVEDDFGGTRFQAESATRGEDFSYDGHPFSAADHSKYFTHDTESLFNISQIVTGDYYAVGEAGPVHDPWYGGPQDPEGGRTPTTPDTDGAL